MLAFVACLVEAASRPGSSAGAGSPSAPARVRRAADRRDLRHLARLLVRVLGDRRQRADAVLVADLVDEPQAGLDALLLDLRLLQRVEVEQRLGGLADLEVLVLGASEEVVVGLEGLDHRLQHGPTRRCGARASRRL
jgi:hypothetical protein